MAIESKNLVSINTEEAVMSVRKLKEEISSLRDAWLNAEEGTEEYDNITKQLVTDQEKLNQVMSVGKSQVSAATGSYNALVNQMAALKKVWRETTSEVQRQALGDKIRSINDQLKAYDDTIGNNQRKVGSYEQALATLNKQWDSQKQELAALKTALDNLDPSSKEYITAFERAAEITHNLQERQEMLRMSANDFGTQLSNVANIGAGLVGGFNAIQGVLTLTGQKSENLTKAMADLQAGIAIVQGLRGVEGLNKSLKAYANWAAKAFDAISDFTSGQKQASKSIQETTKSLDANAVANNQVAGAEANANVGANTLSGGLKGVAGSAGVATAAMTALKAALMSIGIGVVIAGVTGLIKLLSKIGSEAKKSNERAKQSAENYIDLMEDWDQKEMTNLERKLDMMKATGATSDELYREEMKHHQDLMDAYEAEADLMLGTAEKVKKKAAELNGSGEGFGTHYFGLPENIEKMTDEAVSKIIEGAEEAREQAVYEAKGTLSDLKYVNKDVQKLLMGEGSKPIEYIENRIKKMSDNMVVDMRQWSDETIDAFNRIKENGIKTYDDLGHAATIYKQMLDQYRSNYQFDPMSGITNDFNVRAEENIREAEDYLNGEIAAENKAYKERLKMAEQYGKGAAIITDAHNRKIWEIITGHTQSILDRAKAANQTELQNLQDTYEKELKILKQYGRDTTELTKEYEKNRAKIELQERTKAIERTIKLYEEYTSSTGPLTKAYDKMEAAGVSKTTQMVRLLAAKQEEIFNKNKQSLEGQKTEWENLWNEVKDDEKLTLDERQAVYDKFVSAKMALEKLETDHTLEQIRTRKQALDAEIEEIERVYDRAAAAQQAINESPNDPKGRFGRNGGAMSFAGFNQYLWNGGNKSYKMMREDENNSYQIEKERLQEQVDLYKKASMDMSLSEAERTAAVEKESETRKKLATLEQEHLKNEFALEKSEYADLINTITSVGDAIADVMGSIYDSISNVLKSQVNAGKMTEEEMEKQLEKYRWIQYTQTIISTASGMLGAFAQASTNIPPPMGQIVGAANAAAVLAQGIAQLTAIKAASKSSSLGNNTIQASTIQPAEYQPEYSANLTGKSDTDYLRNAMNEQRLFVSVTDINNVQGRVRTTEEESSF